MEWRNAGLNEYEKVKAFFESYYGTGYYMLESEFFSWMFYDNPLRSRVATDEEYTSYCAFDGDDLIACIHYVPCDLYVEGKSYPACWSANSYARDDRSGIAGLLMKKNIRKFSYYMSMAATQWVREIYTSQFGFEYQHNIDRKIMVGQADVCIDILKKNKRNILENFSELHAWQKETEQAAEQGAYFRIKNINDLNDQYWIDHLKVCRATVAKDRELLKWRYFEHPFIDYDIISADENQDAGLAVIRPETIKDSEIKVARLLDYMPTIEHQKDLANAVARYVMDQKAAFLDFFCGSRKFMSSRVESPFVDEKRHLNYMFPRMLQPVEWRDRYSINASFHRNHRKEGLPEVALEEVYFTKGDPCQDVVLNKGYKTKSI